MILFVILTNLSYWHSLTSGWDGDLLIRKYYAILNI
jgi:hypothetical protein